MTIKTKKGSVIKRYQDNVGKYIGGALYVHKSYAEEIIPKDILDNAMSIMRQSYSDFSYNSLMWDIKNEIIRFDESPDFDIAREPHVGNYITIFLNGKCPAKKGHSDNIWHHKWLWVKDDYKGFNIDNSKKWSEEWLSRFDEPAKGTDLTWEQQLEKHKLK